MTRATFADQLHASIAVLQTLATQTATLDALIAMIAERIHNGSTLYTCGNGGSAADALHLAEELIGRYHNDRPPLPAVCLNADATALTCIANDYGFEQIFARQLQALACPGDLLVCFSTSGNSPNILAALRTARICEVTSIAFLGRDGGAARTLADHTVIVPASNTARIQEAHTLLLHAICEALDE